MRWPAQAASDEPSSSPSSSKSAKPDDSPPSSDATPSVLVEALILNTRAQLELVAAIRELIEYGASQAQAGEESGEEWPTVGLDGTPIRRS